MASGGHHLNVNVFDRESTDGCDGASGDYIHS